MIAGGILACSGAPPEFDAARAMKDLVAQCDFGPRPPGSAAHDSCRVFLVERLRTLADTVIEQRFAHYDSLRSRSLTMTNIIARFGGDGKRRMLCAHWDTRPIAEHDPDSSRQHEPILGANDGASGVAVLLEMARLFSLKPPPTPVEIVLFDGEDYGPPGRLDLYLLGSQFFSRQARPADYEFAVLLDMVGDADLRLGPEEYSRRFAPELIDLIWSAAEKLGITEFDRHARYSLFDDHIPLLQVGIPAVDIIDFDYPPWHTHADTPDKCSAESLEKVGRVLVEVLYNRP
jgi:Zn-dependent M28 family amino/carboxypeptidase